jgi:hypothetical protein
MNQIQDIAVPVALDASARTERQVGRSIRAVFTGLLSTFALTTAVDMALHAAGVFPAFGQPMSDALFVLALAYRIPLNTLGCVLAARLAPARPMRHALALGLVGVGLATLGAVLMWDCGPAWYSLANIAVALPCAWCGGRLYRGKERG